MSTPDRDRVPAKEVARKDIGSTQFGELQVAERVPILHVESHNGISTKRSTTSTTNAGSTASTDGLIQLTTGTNADDDASLQTNASGEYASSREATVAVGAEMEQDPADSQLYRWGGYHADDGLFFERDASNGLRYGIRSGGSDRYLTGSGVDSSAVLTDVDLAPGDINFDRLHIWGIDFAWYAAGGRITWYIEEPRQVSARPQSSSKQILAQYFPEKDSQNSGAYMETPNVPIRTEAVNDPNDSTAPSSGLDMRIGGRQYSISGAPSENRRLHTQHFVFDGSADGAQPGTSFSPVVALRPQSTFNGRENGVNVRVDAVDFSAGDAADVKATVGTTFSSATWNDLDSDYSSSESVVEIATEPTIDTRGEPARPRARAAGGGQGKSVQASGAVGNVLGVTQSYLIEAKTDTSADFRITLQWTESF